MKHAYLIIAHNEFKILDYLISSLDDERNDIYIHIDAKVKNMPKLVSKSANLFFISERVDVRWGNVSQIKAEYALFEASFNSKIDYQRYHLISGTHLPLQSQDDLHRYFEKNKNDEILSFIYTNDYEVKMKLSRYHLLVRFYQDKRRGIRIIAQFLWKTSLKIQYLLNLYRDPLNVNIKANNWVSLTHDAVAYILKKKEYVLNRFKWTFCGDEFFIPFLLQNADIKFEMKNDKKLLFNEFENANVRFIELSDYKVLKDSGYLFARKFTEKDLEIVHLILSLNNRTQC